jgi:hypothetical protein
MYQSTKVWRHILEAFKLDTVGLVNLKSRTTLINFDILMRRRNLRRRKICFVAFCVKNNLA